MAIEQYEIAWHVFMILVDNEKDCITQWYWSNDSTAQYNDILLWSIYYHILDILIHNNNLTDHIRLVGGFNPSEKY